MSLSEELLRLAAMHDAGHLSDEEFTTAKQHALRSSHDSGAAIDTEAGPAAGADESAVSEGPRSASHCTTCGEVLQSGRPFCESCGTRTGSGAEVPSTIRPDAAMKGPGEGQRAKTPPPRLHRHSPVWLCGPWTSRLPPAANVGW